MVCNLTDGLGGLVRGGIEKNKVWSNKIVRN